MTTWRGEPEPQDQARKLGVVGVLRLLRRAVPVILVLCLGLVGLMVARAAELLFCRGRRRISPVFAMLVSRFALKSLGFRTSVKGQPMMGGGAVVANHS